MMRSCIFSIITPVFRNHFNMLRCCSINISDYYQCWKQLCCTIFLWKLWSILFFMNTKIKRTAIIWIINILHHFKCLYCHFLLILCRCSIKVLFLNLFQTFECIMVSTKIWISKHSFLCIRSTYTAIWLYRHKTQMHTVVQEIGFY